MLLPDCFPVYVRFLIKIFHFHKLPLRNKGKVYDIHDFWQFCRKFIYVCTYSDFQSPSSNIGFPLMSLYCKWMAKPVTLQMQIQMQY